jgi:hypothetical protein
MALKTVETAHTELHTVAVMTQGNLDEMGTNQLYGIFGILFNLRNILGITVELTLFPICTSTA